SDGLALNGGGGLAVERFSDVHLSRVVLAGNEVVPPPDVPFVRPNGGAIQASGSGARAALIDFLVVGNVVHANPLGDFSPGGGIDNVNGATLTVVNSTIADNHVFAPVDAFGGGIHQNVGSSTTVVNSIISGNEAVGDNGLGQAGGGGISSFDASVSITGSTLT